VGLDPSAEQWFRFLCPERLAIDIKDNRSAARRSAGSRVVSKSGAGANDSNRGSPQSKRRGGGRGGGTAPHSSKKGNSRAGAAWGNPANAAGGTRQGRGSAEQARGRKAPAKTPKRLSMEKIERKAAQRKAAKQKAAGEDRK
jgi:hypothetical protein